MALVVINAATVERLVMEILTGAGLTVLSDLDKDPAPPAAGDPEAARIWTRLHPVSLRYLQNHQNDGDTQVAEATIRVAVVCVVGATLGSMYDPAAAAHAVVAALTGATRALTATRIAVRVSDIDGEIVNDEERSLAVRVVTATARVTRTSGND